MLRPSIEEVFNEANCNQTIDKIDKINKNNAKDKIREKDVFDKKKSNKVQKKNYK